METQPAAGGDGPVLGLCRALPVLMRSCSPKSHGGPGPLRRKNARQAERMGVAEVVQPDQGEGAPTWGCQPPQPAVLACCHECLVPCGHICIQGTRMGGGRGAHGS